MPSREGERQAIDYILNYRGKFSRAQIDEALSQSGHDPEAIEDYWIGVEQGIADAARSQRVHREEHELQAATRGWTAPIIVRTYESSSQGEAEFAKDAAILTRHHYQPTMQSAEGSHLHAGRLLLTGGLSVLAGRRGIRSKGKLTVTYQKVAHPAAASAAAPRAERSDPAEQIRKLAELRDEGILTPEEFEAKKADLLRRM